MKSLYDRENHLQNRDKNIQKACDWQTNNKERKKRYDQERRSTLPKRVYNPESVDPESCRLRSAKRRAAKRLQGAYVVTKKDLVKALGRANNRCTYCDTSFTETNPLEWDHVVPISRGGTHSIGNLVPSCRKCNRSKHIKFVYEWRHGRIVCVRSLALK